MTLRDKRDMRGKGPAIDLTRFPRLSRIPVTQDRVTSEELLEQLVHTLKDDMDARMIDREEWEEYERSHEVETWDFTDEVRPLVAIDGEEPEA